MSELDTYLKEVKERLAAAYVGDGVCAGLSYEFTSNAPTDIAKLLDIIKGQAEVIRWLMIEIKLHCSCGGPQTAEAERMLKELAKCQI